MADYQQKGPFEGGEESNDLLSACQKLGLELGSPRKAAMAAMRSPQAQKLLTPEEREALYGFFRIAPGAFEWLNGGGDQALLPQQTSDQAVLAQLREIEERALRHLTGRGLSPNEDTNFGSQSSPSSNKPQKLN
ncbi:MAG: hypothetical protein WCT53_04925 [Candidatus Gracilibacteria bacterium]